MWFWNKRTRKASYNMQIISEQIRVIINVDISLSYIKNCILTNPCVCWDLLGKAPYYRELSISDPSLDIHTLDIQVNAVATVLKNFFNDTEPLIPPSLHDELLEAAGGWPFTDHWLYSVLHSLLYVSQGTCLGSPGPKTTIWDKTYLTVLNWDDFWNEIGFKL